jgi:hypothetical protein
MQYEVVKRSNLEAVPASQAEPVRKPGTSLATEAEQTRGPPADPAALYWY